MKNLFFFLLFVIFLLTGESQAQWTQVFKYKNYIPQTLISVSTNIFAGFNGYNTSYGGIYRSTDDGKTWSAIDNGLIKNGEDTLNVLKLAAIGDTIIAGTDSEGIFISTNNGNSWKQMNNGIGDSTNQVLNVMALGTHNSKIYAAVSGAGIFISTDTGQNWKLSEKGIPVVYNGYLSGNFHFFGISGTNIYTGADYLGLYYSSNGGENWIALDTALYDDMTCASAMGNNVLIGANNENGGSIWLYSDDGTYITGNLAPYDTILGPLNIQAVTSYNKKVIIGTDDGVYFSSDTGATWSSLNKGWNYSERGVSSMATSNNYLFAGTAGYGIWRIPLSQIVTGIEKPEENLSTNYSFQQNYPNPFNPTTTISYIIPKTSFVTIKIYDVLGRKVDDLVNKEQAAGKYKFKFNALNLSNGVYFCRLKASPINGHSGDFIQVRKMILIK